MPPARQLDPGESPLAFFGAELRRFRTHAELSQEALSAKINYGSSLVGMIETAQRMPTLEFAIACDEALDTGGALERLWPLVSRGRYPSWFGEWREIEREATALRTWQPLVVPGLLQTEGYAGALLGSGEAVQARIERQAILVRDEPEPPMLRVVIDESVLLRPVGSREVMRVQLEKLLKDAENPRISIQVVPMGVHPGLQGGFNLATTPMGGVVGYVETAARGQVVTHPHDLNELNEAYEGIRTEALSRTDSLSLIAKTVKERWT
jgi:transcriptional regulator with XRE-family HTH domain